MLTKKTVMSRTPIHPGEILADELEEIGLKSSHLAKVIGVKANRISQILNAKRAITADTSLHLGRYFGQSEDFWFDLQKQYELDLARKRLAMRLIARTSYVSVKPPGS